MFQSIHQSQQSSENSEDDIKAKKNSILDPNVIMHGLNRSMQMGGPQDPTNAGGSNTAQAMFNEEDEKPGQMKAIQKAGVEEEEVQMKESSTDSTQSASSGSSTQSSLPKDVNARMEASFGANFSNVNIHTNDTKATQMKALAFTQGNNVHFAPGQYNPNTSKGQELIGHEYTHVVQQGAGRVAPTRQAKGMAINDSPALENEADVMGKKAAEGKSASVNGVGSGVQMQEDDKLNVSKGQITFDAEGNDNSESRYFTRKAHWPGGASGVTIGRGYDLAHRGKKEQIIEELNEVGIDSNKFSGAIGLKGESAKLWLESNSEGLPLITHEQQKLLFVKTYQSLENDTERLSTKPDVEEAYGATDWETLKQPIKEVLVDLRYRGDYTPNSRKIIQTFVANNDLKGFYGVISNKSNWGNVPDDRFNRRVNYLKGFIESDVLVVPIEEASTESVAESETEIIPNNIETESTANVSAPISSDMFIVPSGWGLNKIAKHLGVTVEALKASNAEKLKTWGDVQGFGAGEIISIPTSTSTSVESTTNTTEVVPTKVTPEEIITKAFVDYKLGKLSMPDLGRMLIPFAGTQTNRILAIFKILPSEHRDNLAYVMAVNSDDTQLGSFPRNMLELMKNELGGYFNTTSWKLNWEQKNRIEKLMGQNVSVKPENADRLENSNESGNGTNAIEVKINEMMANERLTPIQISDVRNLIDSLPDSKKATYYLQLQSKVNYKNQRNNAASATEDDLKRNAWMKTYNVTTAGDIMCNLTSMAMALETLGISNPEETMQFEDYLEKLRIEKFGDAQKRTNPDTWIKLAKELGVKAEKIEINSFAKSTIEGKLQSHLEKGHGISISVFSYSSDKGHIVRLQAIGTEGLVVDDPYGDVSQYLGERESGSNGYREKGVYDNRNSKTSEEGKGEDNLWTWDELKETIIKYAVVFHTDNIE